MHYVFGLVLVGAMLAVVAVGLSSAAAFVTDDGIQAAFRGFTPLQPEAPSLQGGEEGRIRKTRWKPWPLGRVVTGFTAGAIHFKPFLQAVGK